MEIWIVDFFKFCWQNLHSISWCLPWFLWPSAPAERMDGVFFLDKWWCFGAKRHLPVCAPVETHFQRERERRAHIMRRLQKREKRRPRGAAAANTFLSFARHSNPTGFCPSYYVWSMTRHCYVCVANRAKGGVLINIYGFWYKKLPRAVDTIINFSLARRPLFSHLYTCASERATAFCTANWWPCALFAHKTRLRRHGRRAPPHAKQRGRSSHTIRHGLFCSGAL